VSVFQLTNKVAVVTGGGTGIGKGIALEYAKSGADVVLASRNRENLSQVADEIRSLGRQSLVVPTDICDPEQVENLMAQTVDRFGRIDILVNNAGIGDTLTGSKVEELSFENWKATIDLNLNGTFLCSVTAGKVMIEQNKGKLVNVLSCVGLVPFPRLSDYSASKAGATNLTRSLAKEWAPYNINVNGIAPGMIATERHHTAHERTADDGTPKPRLRLPGNPQDVGHLAVFLGCEASDYMTGEIISLMGDEMRGY